VFEDTAGELWADADLRMDSDEAVWLLLRRV
jgi:hypothetical protein